MEHDEARFDIPAWAAGRLDPAAQRRLEAHLAECAACDAMASSALTLAQAIELGGAELFEAHPDEEALRLHAQGIRSSGSRDLDRHLASCASCSLELQAWQSRRTAENPGRQRAARWREVGIAAAGVAAGLLLGLLAAPAMREPREHPPAALTAVPRVTLQSALRGPGGEPELTWDESATQALVDAVFDLPEGLDPAGSVRFEILDATGRRVWETTESAADLSANLARHELVGFLVPTAVLAEGRHRLEVWIEHSASPQLLEAPFGVRRIRSR